MKGIVVGGGSIGTRHLKNLKLLGVEDLGLVEANKERCTSLASSLDVSAFSTLDEGLAWNPSFAVVATPTHLHVGQALQVARSSCHLFVEKPLSHTAEGLVELHDLVKANRLVSMVGCNMRFHPGPAKVKELIQQNCCGKVLFARIYGGSYLPDWRPNTDYRANYAAHEQTGGGCILDYIHEVDLARWYLGDVQEIFCLADHLSSLEISTEDFASLICRHRSRAVSEIHLDYLQRTYERGCQIVGETGSIFWNFNEKKVKHYDATSTCWTTFDEPPDWQVNQMYVDEMRHFLECIRFDRQSVSPVSEAVSVMSMVFAAKMSARENRMIAVGEVAS